MRVVIQRVSRAEVRLLSQEVSAHVVQSANIGPGLVMLVAFKELDQQETNEWMTQKCLGLRVFGDDSGIMNLSVVEKRAEVLVVPNFTLYGDARKGRRPSYSQASPPDRAREQFESFVACLKKSYDQIHSGFFQEHMEVELVNDGPVTLFIEK